MKKAIIIIWVILWSLGFASGSACQAQDTVSAVIVAPKILYSDTVSTLSVTAVTIVGQTPAVVPVGVWFRTDISTSLPVFEGITDTSGRLMAQFVTPEVTPGIYTLEVSVGGISEFLTASIEVSQRAVLLIETDKPIYKPGQTIQGRVLVLNNELRPVPADSEVSLEISDGKGIKIFRKPLRTNAFGVAPFQLDLASELNYGTWKISAASSSTSSVIDVRVEKYVLPRFEVKVVTERDYFLVDEPISGTVQAHYFFGKPVEGTVIVRASRYVGIWEEYATYTGILSNGRVEFSLPAVGYVTGTPGAGGAGSVQLDLQVIDPSGHEEKTTKLLKIVDSTIQHQIIATSRVIVPGAPFEVLLVAENQEGAPVTVSAEVTCEYFDEYWGKLAEENCSLEDFPGITSASFIAPQGVAIAVIRSTVRSTDATADAQLTIYAAYSPSDSFLHLSRASDEPISVGDTILLDVFKTNDATVYYDVFARGHTVWSEATTASQISFQATPQMAPSLKVIAYIIDPNNEILADSLPLEVTWNHTAALAVTFDADQVLPGDPVQLSIQSDQETMVGLAIVDESVYALNEGRLNMQEV